jgi:hypothetical protein
MLESACCGVVSEDESSVSGVEELMMHFTGEEQNKHEQSQPEERGCTTAFQTSQEHQKIEPLPVVYDTLLAESFEGRHFFPVMADDEIASLNS